MGHGFEALSGKILEAAVAVHKALGPGFLESVYQKAMEVALRHRSLPFQEQKEMHIFFEEEDLVSTSSTWSSATKSSWN